MNQVSFSVCYSMELNYQISGYIIPFFLRQSNPHPTVFFTCLSFASVLDIPLFIAEIIDSGPFAYGKMKPRGISMKPNAGVFFDCWETVLKFEEKVNDWNVRPLFHHAVNRKEIDWDAVQEFSERFFHDYYLSFSLYEITVNEYLNLLVWTFHIVIDAPLSVIADEIFDYLNPSPVEGLPELIKSLDEREIPYAILSNTIYTQDASMKLIDRLIPGHHFRFFLASSDIGVKKPNPLFFQTGVIHDKKDIHESVYIGDSFYQDVVGSYRAGFKKSIWLNRRKKDRHLYRDRVPNIDAIPCEDVSSYEPVLSIIEGMD